MSAPIGPANARVWRELSQWLARETAGTAAPAARGTRPPIGFGSLMLIVGPTGTGKTHMVRAICAEADYDLHELHGHNCDGARDFAEAIAKATRSRLVQSLSGRYRPTVIFIDELDTLIQTDRLMLTALADLLQAGELPHTPIVAACPPSCVRKLGQFKSKSAVLRCAPLGEGDMYLWLRARAGAAPDAAAAPGEAEALMRIAEAASGNLHVAARLLDEHRAARGAPAPPPIGPQTDGEPDFHCVFRDATPAALADAIRVFSDDPWLHPLRFHENLLKELRNRKGLARDKRAAYGALLRALTDWDAWMTAGETELACEMLARNVRAHLGRLPRRARAAVGAEDLQDFTKMFSQISIYKKQERALYANDADGFPWADAQIFCRYSSSSASLRPS